MACVALMPGCERDRKIEIIDADVLLFTVDFAESPSEHSLYSLLPMSFCLGHHGFL